MSRWLKNVNALLENLDSQVGETVEERRFERAVAGIGVGGVAGEGGAKGSSAEELLREEARGVDDVLARRGLLDDAGEEDEEEGGEGNEDVDGGGEGGDGGNDGGNIDAANDQLEGGAAAADVDVSTDPKILGIGAKDEAEVEGTVDEGAEGGVAASEVTVDFGGDSDANDGDGNEPKKDLFADGDSVPAAKDEVAPTGEAAAPGSDNPTEADGEESAVAATTPRPKRSPHPVPHTAPAKSNDPAAAPSSSSASSLKELRRLRRHVLQLNSELETSEREVDAQRRELDRAASRMERDRSRHKQEKEAAAASRKAEAASLAASHERATGIAREEAERAVGEAEGRAERAERRRVAEGGERDSELADALKRERLSIAEAERLREGKSSSDGRLASLASEGARLEARLEDAAERAESAVEMERVAEERLDEALRLHARQLGVRQRRESELERTVADLGAALVVAKTKVEGAAGGFGRPGGAAAVPEGEDPADLRARLQDSRDEADTLRAQLGLERGRCSALHVELQELSTEQAEELSGAHARQRQCERKISDLVTAAADLRSSRGGRGADGEAPPPEDPARGGEIDGATAGGDQRSGQYSGDEKKETDHLRKQITSLTEKVFEMQTRIDSGRGEVSTLKNRLRSSQLQAETAEKGLEGANQRLIMMDVGPGASGMSSADEGTGPFGRRAAGRRRRPPARGTGAARRWGSRPKEEVESVSSALGLRPGRFPPDGRHEALSSLLDAFDALAVDLGGHLRRHPLSRLAFLLYLAVLHGWAFFLLVYHAHAQGTAGDHVGPEALLRSYRHLEQVPKAAAALAAVVAPQAATAAAP